MSTRPRSYLIPWQRRGNLHSPFPKEQNGSLESVSFPSPSCAPRESQHGRSPVPAQQPPSLAMKRRLPQVTGNKPSGISANLSLCASLRRRKCHPSLGPAWVRSTSWMSLSWGVASSLWLVNCTQLPRGSHGSQVLII